LKIPTVVIIIIFSLIGISLFQSYIPNLQISECKTDALRIGYLNLNQSKMSSKDIDLLLSFKCDLWLFAEWNGNNLDDNNAIFHQMNTIYEKVDKTTYGFLVLKNGKLSLNAKEIEDQNSYACNYKKILLENNDVRIGLVHAPPPVPSCKYDTNKYLNHVVKYFNNNFSQNSNKIIIGDFNALPFSNGYKEVINNGYKDVFKSTSWFKGTFGFFNWSPKFLRIDYCFTNGNFEIFNKNRFKVKSSDHCGLLLDIKILNN